MKKEIFLSFFLCLGFLASAQVVINEYSAANYSDIDFQTGPGSAYEDWIELYNTSGTTVDLGGYFLSDKLNNIQKWSFPAGVTIPGNGHLVILASSRNGLNYGYQNTNFKLTQTDGNEYVILANTAGIIVDSIRLNYANQKNDSRGRI
ncbi:lamin tail domain-containing protein, partial [Chitinophagales bacterium]|nr:lamin tail domain-containing protein [Chitinophagales bacterium]